MRPRVQMFLSNQAKWQHSSKYVAVTAIAIDYAADWRLTQRPI